MKKKINIIIGLIIFIFFAWSLSLTGNVASFFYSENSCKQLGNNKWLSLFPQVIKAIDSNRKIVSLEKITPFDWDKFYLIHPYTSDTSLIELFGFKPSLLGCTKIYFKDDRNLIVFQKGKSLVAYGDVLRKISWIGFPTNKSIDKKDMTVLITHHGENVTIKKIKVNRL